MALAFSAHLNRVSTVRPDGARALALAQPLPVMGGSATWRTTRALALLSGAGMAAVAQKCKTRRAQRQRGLISRAAARPARGFGSDKRGNKKVVLDFEKLMRVAEGADAAKQKEIERRVDAGYSTWTWAHMQQLQSALLEPENLAAQRIAHAVSLATQTRLEPATKALQDVIDRVQNDSEAVVEEILTTVKKAESPIPYVMAFETAIGQYKEAGRIAEQQGLERVRAAVVEDLDRSINPTGVFLSRVVAEEDSSERDAILRKLLEPSEASKENKQKLPSMVAASFTYMVEKMLIDKSIEDDERHEAVEQIRRVAKEARLVIGELYGETKLKQFSADLSAAFKKHRAWQKKQQELKLQQQQQQQQEQQRKQQEDQAIDVA